LNALIRAATVSLSRLELGEVKVPSHQGWILSFVLIFLVFTLIYKFAPYGDVQWGQVLPGALLAAVLFELCKGGFVIYLDRMTNFEEVYGPLSSIIVLLLWLYLSALILVFGAEYNIVRWKAGKEAAATASGGAE
jgi:YihY family inner membrane protein